VKRLLIVSCCLLTTMTATAADWLVSYKNDEMRGTAQKFIQTDSDNAVDFDFPYDGGSKMTIVLRSKKQTLKEGKTADKLPLTEAVILISKGQFSCNSYQGCSISAKFDDGKILKYSMTEAADGSADVIFVDNSASFIKNVKSHKKLIVEADFYQAGAKQFKFDLSGLETPKS
jgi:hypothetical protein